jgi:predicted ATPase
MDKHLDHFEIQWKNFKGFTDTGWIKIKPVTIILGSNNAGKTNFLAPLLLMNQTINSRDRFSPLILKGETYDGGNYQEIAKDYDKSNEIHFGFQYHLHNSDEKLDKVGSYPPGGFDVTFKLDTKTQEIKLKQKSIYDIYKRKLLSLKLQRNNKYALQETINLKLNSNEKEAITNCEPINFMFSPNTVLAEIEDLSRKKQKKNTAQKEIIKRKTIRFTSGFSEFLSAISYNNNSARNYLGDLSFLGPIREIPHRTYEITNETYETVGPKGENLPNLLKKIGTNKTELNYWIKKFGFGDELHMEHLYSNSYSLRFLKENSSLYTSIANAGFGASQILPLIIQLLVSPKRSITIAEQPEIHLNPKLQCELADLFVAFAEKKQYAIVETHSEHLLLRLRRLVADGKISSENVAIYFVEQKDNNSVIREIKLEENGHIKPIEWPKDFFGESLKEALALATIQSKNKLKPKIND